MRNTVSANELTASGTAVPDQATNRTTALGNMRIVKAIYSQPTSVNHAGSLVDAYRINQHLSCDSYTIFVNHSHNPGIASKVYSRRSNIATQVQEDQAVKQKAQTGAHEKL